VKKVGEIMNIMGNTSKDDAIVLGGREFKRVKNGLDEAQVASFIDELIKERDKLAQSQNHIASLNRLAEMTIVEADKLATRIKTETTEQAKAESAAIVDKAKEQARQMAEKSIAEAVGLANEKANTIRAKAKEEATLLLENEKSKIRNELRSLVNQQCGYLLEELERLKQQAVAIQADFDNKSPEPVEQQSTATVKIAGKRDAAVAIAKESGTTVEEESKKPFAEHLEPGKASAYSERGSGLLHLLHNEEQPESGKPQWEVEILPPFEIAKIMEVVAFLDRLPEVANTEMIVPQIDMPSVLIFLRKPMNVVDALKTIPAVAYVEEVTTGKTAAYSKPRKVRMGLLSSTTLQKK
jgi:cell division septum initiation protein DivIVA